ncbi:DUF6907 domain-containing protein [Streptomyces sp. NPDC001205]
MSAATSMPEVPVTSHPTGCPSWCSGLGDPLGHEFGPTNTVHWGNGYLLRSPLTVPQGGDGVLMRARLYRYDEAGEPVTPKLIIHAEEEAELDAIEADILIAHTEAFLGTLRALRAQMEPSRRFAG